ncbi:MAG TPA: TonB-dependent receptor [Rhizomicrobium sp.]|jgi:iron complex outermembrane receptor protein|nr:TonB-dependent receptor [Rhizomicrobium sp.]
MLRLRQHGLNGGNWRQYGTALALICIAQSARADDVDPFALSPEQLFDATVVSVSKTAEKLGDAPAAVFVLSSEDIARSGATSIPELLRLVPGVDVARGGAASWAVGVRGFNGVLTDKLLVLIDGREVYDPLFSGVYWDVQDLPLQDIERIEVIRGPGATLWGANAVNGVINIITKKASQTKGALLKVTAGNQDRAIVTARYGGDIDDNIHMRIYAKYRDEAPDETLSGANANDQWTEWRGGFRADTDVDSAGDTFTLQGDGYHSETGQLRTVPLFAAPYNVVEMEDITADGGNVLGRWNRALGEDSSLTVQTYVDLTARDQLTLKDHRTTFDFDAQYELPALAWNKFIAGVHYRYTSDKLDFTSVIFGVKDTDSEQTYSGFVQDKITVVPNDLFLTLGSKFEHNDFTGFEWQPSGRLQWLIDSDDMAWTAVSRAVRTPSEIERDLTAITGTIPPSVLPFPIVVELTPSPDFKSEDLIAYEVGYRRQWTSTLQMDVTGFYNDYSRLSTLSLEAPTIAVTPPPQSIYIILPLESTNLTTGKTYGFEGVLNWRAMENLNLSASYSYLHMQLDGPPSSEAIASEAAVGQSPRNQFNVRSQWDVTDRVAFDTTVYYVDALPGYDVSAYWRLDARIGWRMTDELQLDVVGQNLSDDSHREIGNPTDSNAIAIGRGVYGRLTWRS